jgi:hypothetical protein
MTPLGLACAPGTHPKTRRPLCSRVSFQLQHTCLSQAHTQAGLGLPTGQCYFGAGITVVLPGQACEGLSALAGWRSPGSLQIHATGPKVGLVSSAGSPNLYAKHCCPDGLALPLGNADFPGPIPGSHGTRWPSPSSKGIIPEGSDPPIE